MASNVGNTVKRPHVLDEDRYGIMRASQRTLEPLIEKEAEIYSEADLKVRFRWGPNETQAPPPHPTLGSANARRRLKASRLLRHKL